MSRNTRTFTDLDLNFTANPATGDVSRKYDENAIRQSLKNLVMTNFYERPFHPEIGSHVTSMLFEPFTSLTKVTMERAIANTVNNFEPRVVLQEVDVSLNPDNNTVFIVITFTIANTTRPLSVDILLRRSR